MNIVDEDIVISGIGGLFPKSPNLQTFKERIFNNEYLLEARWPQNDNVSNMIGKIPCEYFDNAYFGIHRQQCTYMDPMHRLALERTFEALIDAGVNPTEVKGKKVGVFIGSTVGENDNLFVESVVSGFGVTGHSRAMMPNRISYWLNLKGPSVAYDSNWVSGIEVLRLAYDAIKSGQCDSVIVGTANLAIHAEFQWIYNSMGLLSSDGKTRAFDANASGYGRTDGVVVMYIQRASEARRSYASIIHVAARFDGCREGDLITMNADNMTEFIEDFYKKCPIDPDQIEYVETYGCGLKDVDEVEGEVIDRIYTKNRKEPLLIGSVKSQTGHAEASAAMFSIVKVLLAMEERLIPANIDFEIPNPNIKGLVDGRLAVVTKNTKWGGLYAAVNSIGINSYYGHLVVKSNLKEKVPIKMDLPMLLLASTRTETGIVDVIETLKGKPKDAECYKLVHQIFSKPIQGHLYRGYATIGAETPKQETVYHMGNKRQIWFVYSGMGSQWAGMASDLMKINLFEQSIKRSHDILAPKGVDLLNIITSTDKTIFDNILNCFVGIAAMQIALTDILRALGIVPDGIIGHSVGELGCAYADNCITAEQMILSAYCRGRASLEATLITGMMAAIGLGYNQIKHRLPPTIEVACHNSADSCTISGPVEEMKVFVKDLQDQGIFARLVNVANIAYHSQYIKPAAPLLLRYLQDVLPQPVARSSKWISTSNKEENWGTELAQHSSAEYHTNNLLSSVLFEEGCKHIPKDSVLIEIAPHGLLQAILKRSVKSATNISLTQRGAPSGTEYLLESLGKLYLSGLDFDISQLYPKIEYPVSRGTPFLSDIVQWNHTDNWRSGVADRFHSLFGVNDVDVTLTSEEFRECVGHQMNNCVVFPLSSYINILFQILENISSGQTEFIFENLHFRRPLIIPRQGSVAVHAMIQKGSGEFEVISDDQMLISGKVVTPESGDKLMVDTTALEVADDSVLLTNNDFYNELRHRGHKYSGNYKTVKSVRLAEKGSLSLIQLNGKWVSILEAIVQQRILSAGERKQDLQVPKLIQKIVISLNDLPTEKTEMQVEYDYATNILTTKGMQVIGMTTVPLDVEVNDVNLRTLESVSLKGNRFQKIEKAIEFSMELTMSNYFYNGTTTTLFVTEIENGQPLIERIETIIKENNLLRANATYVTDYKNVVVQQVYPQLIIENGVATPGTYQVIISSEAYLLSKTDANLPTSELIEVAQFFVGDESYSLIKKIDKPDVTNVTVKGDTLSSKDIKRSSLPWVTELYAAAEEARSKNSIVYLTSSIIPIEGFNNFIQELKSLPNMDSVRFIFNLDKKNYNYSDLYKKKIVTNIIRNGTHCTLLPFSLKQDENLGLEQSVKTIIKNTTVEYLSVNLKDETINPATLKENEVGSIDYSGVSNTGENTMGLAYLDESFRVVEDPIFKWVIPEYFSVQDGATIPYAYVNAFYMLMIKARLKPGETVLIHAGCSPIGLAAISIASTHGCQIFVTVSADWQKAYLKKHFTFFRDHQILSSDDSSFESLLLLNTGGKGAEVILNCLSGSLLTSSLACIADYGRFIQYGKYDLEEGNSIGMYCFLRNTSFYVVDLCNVFLQPKEVKNEIRKYIQDGMNDLTVRPLRREVTNDLNVRNMLSQLKDSTNIGKKLAKTENVIPVSRFNVKKPNRFICQSKSSYLIYGGTAENWTDVSEYLVHRGARKIVIASESKPQSNYISRRLSLLQTYYGSDIIMAPNKANTKEAATELLSEVYALGPIHAVITLPNKTASARSSDTKQVQYLDTALRTIAPKAVLINFINVAAGVCQVRADAKFATRNVQWANEKDVMDSVSVLDDILRTNAPYVLIIKDKDGDSRVTVQNTFQDLTKIMPSVEELIKGQEQQPEEPDLVQVITEGPLEIRELAPIFIIPGLTGFSVLEDMLKSLLYPTFCAVYPSKPWPLDKLADTYVEKMRAIFPKGVYNIISVSWGGALAIEVARRLQEQKASLHLFFVDSSPLSLQQAFHQLGETQSDIEINILRKTLGIHDATILQKLKSGKDWKSRITLALENFKGQPDEKDLLLNGLVCLKDRIEAVAAYRPNDVVVTGKIHLIRPETCSQFDDCGLSSYCNEPIKIVLVDGDHLTIAGRKDTSDYINRWHYVK